MHQVCGYSDSACASIEPVCLRTRGLEAKSSMASMESSYVCDDHENHVFEGWRLSGARSSMDSMKSSCEHDKRVLQTLAWIKLVYWSSRKRLVSLRVGGSNRYVARIDLLHLELEEKISGI